MGADIHAFIEIKHKGKWFLYDQPNPGRDYELFNKMAGVRGDGKDVIVPPKGLPDDLSNIVRLEAQEWDGDAHTHSWFNIEEIGELMSFYDDERAFYDDWGWSFDNFDEASYIENMRLIFWFDN